MSETLVSRERNTSVISKRTRTDAGNFGQEYLFHGIVQDQAVLIEHCLAF